jgi:hypothetical protein
MSRRKFWSLPGFSIPSARIGTVVSITAIGDIVPSYSPAAMYPLGEIYFADGTGEVIVKITDPLVEAACAGLVEDLLNQSVIADNIRLALQGNFAVPTVQGKVPPPFNLKGLAAYSSYIKSTPSREYLTTPAPVPVKLAHRDANGSLICTNCGEPYPYAEPAHDGSFVCSPCKVVM